MSFDLEFDNRALKEWEKLGHTVQSQFKKKLKERLTSPHVASCKLSGAKNRYKIKLRQSGYRLVYEVNDTTVVVKVISVGKRNRNVAYETAKSR